MDFRHPDGRQLSVLVPRRSLLVMTGPARYIWSHGITPRKSDIVPLPAGGITLAARGVRVSFTFRKLSATAGILPQEQTDSPSCLPRTQEEAAALEKQHVHEVYEEIADHFSDTRHKPWPQIAQFLMDQDPGSVLVDIGCGNGKYFGVNTQLCQIGSDRSQNLASIVQLRGYEVFVGDVLAIPLRSACVDVALCIAVIHHLSIKARRRQAVEELVRILRPGGCVLIYVWAQEQQKDNQKSTYLKPCRQHRKEARTQKADSQGMETSPQTEAETPCEGLYQTEVSCERDCVPIQKPERVSTCLEQGEKHGSCGVQDRKDNDPAPVVTEEAKQHTSSADVQVLQVHVNRTEFKEQDMLVPWQLKKSRNKGPQSGEGECREGQTFHRFYHVFQQGELDALCSEVADCVIKRTYYDQGNWCVVLQKL